jgi:DNA-binding NtrC family response regulator
MSKRNILIVDDEPTMSKVLSKYVSNMGHNHLVINNGLEVVDFFMNKKIRNNISCHDIDVMLLDLSMPDLDGFSVLKEINPIKGDLQVIVLTADRDINRAINAINLGAIDYIVKGEKDILARVTASVNNAIEKKNLKYQISNLVRKGKDQVVFSDVISHNQTIIDIIKTAKKAVNSNIPIIIEGDTGTGKELLARAIHGSGLRSGKPFIVVECDSLRNNCEEDLLGSEKIDPEYGIKNIGKIREANNGSIFFDKIEFLKPEAQTKLLRFLQDGEVISKGSESPIRVNARVICSTAKIKNLHALVKEKKFREDLFYRISALPLSLPSLKERGEEDIKILATNFCRNFSTSENKKIKGIDNSALYLISNYEWEDNIRQLKNSIYRAVVLCDEDHLKAEHFPQLLNKENNSLTKSKASIKSSSSINSELIDIYDDKGKCKTIEQIENEVIQRLVDIHNGNLSEVSKQLEVGRSTIYRKLKISE